MSSNRTAHSISEHSSETGWVTIERTPSARARLHDDRFACLCIAIHNLFSVSRCLHCGPCSIFQYSHNNAESIEDDWFALLRGVQTVQNRIHKNNIFTRFHRWVGYTGAPCQVIFDRSGFSLSCVLHNESIRVKFCAFKKVHFGHRFYFLQIAQPFSVMSRVADAGVWQEPNRGSAWSASVEIFVKTIICHKPIILLSRSMQNFIFFFTTRSACTFTHAFSVFLVCF